MKNKLKFLIGLSLKKKIKSKWFLVANIVIALLIIGITNIDSIITLFGGDFNNKTTIYVLDETNKINETFTQNIKYYEKNLYNSEDDKYEIKNSEKSIEEIKDLISSEEKDSILVYIFIDENDDVNAKVISFSTMDTYDYQLIVSSLNNSLSAYILDSINLTEEQYNKITSGIKVDREILNEDVSNEEENMEMIMTTVFPMIILPFFMLTIILIQFIGTEINDEKSTKSMEIIISNVSPQTHFASKIISNNVFIVGQVLLVFIYSIIGLKLRGIVGGNAIVNGLGSTVSGFLSNIRLNVFAEKFLLIILLAIVLMILTFIAYSLLAGILASMTTNAEDYQHVQTPLVIILLVGYYLATMAGVFNGSVFIRVLSYFPLISAILSPSLLVIGQIGVVDVLISIGIMVLFIWVLIKYGMRIYKVGILNYSQTGIWKKIFKSIKEDN